MAESTRVLELTFSTELNKNHVIRINNARADLTAGEAVTVMDDIVSRNIFSGPGGEITGKVRAQIVSRQVEDLVLT